MAIGVDRNGPGVLKVHADSKPLIHSIMDFSATLQMSKCVIQSKLNWQKQKAHLDKQ